MNRCNWLPLAIILLLVGCDRQEQAQLPPQEPDQLNAAETLPADVITATAATAVGETAGYNPQRNAYFGETHVHTSYSLDAYLGGNRLTPADAYRFGRGEAVTVNGQPHQRKRALDFVAVTDHAEYLGEMYSAMNEGAPGYDNELLVQLRNMTSLEERRKWFVQYVVSSNRSETPQHPPFFAGPDTVKSAWQVMIDSAEDANKPGDFTAFIAFEWSGAPRGGNLHRNVIYRDANVPDAPVSYIDINREDGLWEWLREQESKGVKAFAIPHNSNASKGMMFPDTDAAGDPMDLEYAQLRQHFEPLVEMMQTKGNSEVHRKFWSADEFADFENADSIQNSSGRIFSKRDFVREGLKVGLSKEQQLGVNPFKLGFIGGTDNHNGVPSDVAEDGFIGGHGAEDGTVERRRTEAVAGWINSREESIGSLAGVWATENTRAAIWDAMRRRETFATSGPRITVRFFGGVDLPATGDNPERLVADGYELGVPMGGDLGAIGAPPTFTAYAMKDPDGANLDRIQIIKGWVDTAGDTHEKIVDVAWSGERKTDEGGNLPPVGDTVDLATATYRNDIGTATLIGSWTDAEFDPEQHAFYYARVLEIPTPRWTTYEAVRNNLPLLEDVPSKIQERAWSSPIWVKP